MSECNFAVFVLDPLDNQWKIISFGDSELECQLWVNEHLDAPYLKDMEYRIGVITDYVFTQRK